MAGPVEASPAPAPPLAAELPEWAALAQEPPIPATRVPRLNERWIGRPAILVAGAIVICAASVLGTIWAIDYAAREPARRDREAAIVQARVAEMRAKEQADAGAQAEAQAQPKRTKEKADAEAKRKIEESKSRVQTLIEKAAKLRAMTDQGVELTRFQDQLAETKAAWDTMSFNGWPAEWQREREGLAAALAAWNLANELWQEKERSRHGTVIDFYSNAYDTNGRAKLWSLAKLVTRVTGNRDAESALGGMLAELDGPDPIEKGPLQQRLSTYVSPNHAIRWCFLAAASAYDAARDGLRTKFKN
jgi:hypothetical protein